MLPQDFKSYVDYSPTIFVKDQCLLLCGYSTYRQNRFRESSGACRTSWATISSQYRGEFSKRRTP
ncbi:hypothetical protein T4B_3777 [Trichinella pseudospiralis]|uniref:Uncharacterized protein n=1 Tax=Trichinella pseudospiralis TaxID=6337 RepID=A0A0V1HA30_TRIPS|nr:hypothetical protein T4B_3777 [Trichinella pseudospiralis]